jgi:hypothetical protein
MHRVLAVLFAFSIAEPGVAQNDSQAGAFVPRAL